MSKDRGKYIGVKFTEALIGDISGLDPPVGYQPGSVDLAQGKTVTVGNAAYGVGTRAVDGSDSTYWGTYSTLPWWIIIDLGESKRNAGFYILQSNSSYRAKDYVVLGSDDGETFTQIGIGQLLNVAEQTIVYSTNEYRYIRINFTSYWSSSRAYIYTLKILEAAPVGNENAFTVNWQELLYINGPLIAKSHKPISVTQHPTEEKSILLGMDQFQRFNNVVGNITIVYNKILGNLKGVGGFLEDFELPFIPEDLISKVDPHSLHIFEVTPTVTLNLIEVGYEYGYTREIFEATPTMSLELIDVGEINP